MANVLNLLHKQSFSSSSSIEVTHNLDRENLGVQVIVDDVVRADLITDIVSDEADPKNKFTVELSSAQTGVLQVLAPGVFMTTQFTGAEKVLAGHAIHDNVDGEIAAITEKTDVVDDDWMLIEDSEDSNNKKKAKRVNFLEEVTQFSTQLSFTGVTTSTATTDTLISGLTYTPGAGTYMVFAGGSINLSVKNRNMWVSVYTGGTQVAFTEVEFQPGEADAYTPFALTGVLVTVGDGEAIDMRWRRDTGNPPPTMRFQNRHMTIVQVL